MIDNKDEFLKEMVYYSEELKSIAESYGGIAKIEEYSDSIKIDINYGDG